MSDNNDAMIIQGSPERRLFEIFAAGVAYVSVETPSGDNSIGTCFHIGESVFITAKHVAEGNKILKVGTTVASLDSSFGQFLPAESSKIEGPFLHPNPDYDLAALRIRELQAPQIPLLPVAENRPHALVLKPVVVMGYPPIPGSRHPVLLCRRAEINASFVTYFDNQEVLIVSCLGRGGFSGGPALTLPHHSLGVVTRAMVRESLPEELGFMAVVGPWPILELLHHNNIMPRYLRTEMWNQRDKLRR